MEKTKKVFRSRISVLIIVFIGAVFIPLSMPIFQHGNFETAYTLGGAFMFIIFLFSGMRYIISGNKLLFRIWFIPCGSVNIMDIVSVERSYNLLSSPAASIKRLCILFEKKAKFPYALVSPVKEIEFVEELRNIKSDIHVKINDKKDWWRIWNWDI